MSQLYAIAVGGAAGALGRFGVSAAVQRITDTVFPLGTMAVNITGAFLIGFLSVLFGRAVVSPEMRSGVLVGFLGSFTTFSTYMFESVRLLQDGEYGPAAANLIVGNVAGVASVVAGMITARILVECLHGGLQ